ncbi:hypothetical protein [Pseudomonas mangiferae]|uniref:Uncharacterized protein n=1 Tax=Pseudomonas mangiferae TaxID=2593654 RepID=A0A553GT89_9PSED|nr:hypothetical protein [Pseudomonas mangiferae]TRX72719.1 hypothetical protein FM069_21425 [Pseudomonas mangiferae]
MPMKNKHSLEYFFLLIFMVASMKAFPYEKFPVRPLDGLFEVVSSDPSIEDVDPKLLTPELLYLKQKIRFSYMGPVGFDWPLRDEYKITLYPPFSKNYCKRHQWEYICDLKLTDAPLSYDGVLETERLKENSLSDDRFLNKYLKSPPYHFIMMYADGRATYEFFMLDWDTLIYSRGYEAEPAVAGDRNRIIVTQILKRVKE